MAFSMTIKVSASVTVAISPVVELANSGPANLHLSRESVCARQLLAGMLGEKSWEQVDRNLSRTTKGKPVWRDGRIGVSLSHADGFVAAAVNREGEVGVDVQPHTTMQRVAWPARQSAEAPPQGSPENLDLELAWAWVVQEACVKASGNGFADRPWRIPISHGQTAGTWGPYVWRSLRGDSPIPLACAYRSNSAIETADAQEVLKW